MNFLKIPKTKSASEEVVNQIIKDNYSHFEGTPIEKIDKTDYLNRSDSGLVGKLTSPLSFKKAEEVCRICLETSNTSEEEMIKPCACKGSAESVHRKCIDKWVSSRIVDSMRPLKQKCEICKVAFEIEKEMVSFYDSGKLVSSILKYSKFVFAFGCILLVLGIFTISVLFFVLTLDTQIRLIIIILFIGVFAIFLAIAICHFICRFKENSTSTKVIEIRVVDISKSRIKRSSIRTLHNNV